MNLDKKTIVVLPAYNAAKTLKITYEDIPKNWTDEIILVDDKSTDDTIEIAHGLGIKTFRHRENRGYGANQKTCYKEGLRKKADIIVMIHPDYQYDPKIIPNLIKPILENKADAVFGSRMLRGGALEGGMPWWKYLGNIFLTRFENLVLGIKLSEYHSGFRAYSKKYLENINFELNSNGFLFDTEIIIQGVVKGFRVKEIPIKTRYFPEASTIRFTPSVLYGLGILRVLIKYLLFKSRLIKTEQFL